MTATKALWRPCLWDFVDTTNDNNDTVSPGHAAIQQVYTGADFQGNTQCDLRRFLQVWRKLATAD